MVAERTEPETYTIDDTIRVPIELRDDDGVAHVRAIFRRLRYAGELGPRGLDPDHTLELRGNGQNEKHATVETTLVVADEHEPGDYLCVAIQVYDCKGNMAMIANPTPSRVFKHRGRGKEGRQEDRVPGLGRLALAPPLFLVESSCAPGGRSSVGRASDCGSEGRGFEPRRSPSCLVSGAFRSMNLYAPPLDTVIAP